MRQTTRASWDEYWQHYELPNYINHTPKIIETIQNHVPLQGCRVMEIGAGTGGNSNTLASLGACVTALDFSVPSLQRIKATTDTGVALQIVQGDALDLPFADETFDLIFHQGFLEHFTEPSVLVREQRRVLRTGGYLLVDVPQRYNLYTWHKRQLIRSGQWPYGGWEREFSLGELSSLLKVNGFRVIDTYGRGYYPRPFEMIRNLSKMESKVLKREILPTRIWRAYNAFWHYFEKTRLSCHLLQCIGVLAQVMVE